MLERLYENQPGAARARLVQVLLVLAEAAKTEDEQLELYQRVRGVEKNATAIEGIRKIWKERGDRTRIRGDLEGAVAAYRSGGIAELEAEVVRELREKELASALEDVQRLEAQEKYQEAVARVTQLAKDFAGFRDWEREIGRLAGIARLSEDYQNAIHAAVAGSSAAAKKLFAEVLARKPEYKDAARQLFTLVTGVYPVALQNELNVEKQTRMAADARASAAEKQLEVMGHQVAALQKELQGMSARLTALQKELNTVTLERAEVDAHVRTAEKQREGMNNRVAALQKELGTVTLERAEVDAHVRTAEKQREGMNNRVAALQKELEGEKQQRAGEDARACATQRKLHGIINMTVMFLAVATNLLVILWFAMNLYLKNTTLAEVGFVALLVVGSSLVVYAWGVPLVAGIRLAHTMFGVGWTILCCFALLVPGLGLVVLLVLRAKANQCLREAGLSFKVSLLGPFPDVVRRASPMQYSYMLAFQDRLKRWLLEKTAH